MDDRDDDPDILRMAILAILARRGPMSAEEIAEPPGLGARGIAGLA
jgi:hypothetical protein